MNRLELVLWRDRYGLTQSALAELLGVSRSAVQAYEYGRNPIPAVVDLALETLEKRLVLCADENPRRRRRASEGV